MNDRELLAKVRQAYKQIGTKDVPEQELAKLLMENGLTQEESEEAIHTAIKQQKIRFCYTSIPGKGSMVKCYERITKRDILPQEIRDEMLRHAFRLSPKAIIRTEPHAKPDSNREQKHVSYITAYCRYCGKRIKHTIADGTGTCLVCRNQFPYRKEQKKVD